MMRNSPRDVRPEALIASEKLRRFIGKRRNRRLLVVTSMLVFIAMLGTVALLDRLPPIIILPSLVLLALLGCAHGVLLNLGTQLIAAKRPDNLDERQFSLWQRAHHRAYRILVGVLGVMGIYVFVLTLDSTLGFPDTRLEWFIAVLALWMFAVMLPSDVIYWTEPDVLESTP